MTKIGRDGYAANEKAMSHARKEERVRLRQSRDDFIQLMSTAHGRRVMAGLMEDSGALSVTPPMMDADSRSWAEGRRVMGAGLLARAWSLCPNLLAELVKENPMDMSPEDERMLEEDTKNAQ